MDLYNLDIEDVRMLHLLVAREQAALTAQIAYDPAVVSELSANITAGRKALMVERKARLSTLLERLDNEIFHANASR